MDNSRFKFRVWENGRGYLKTTNCALVADGDLIFGDTNTHTIPLAYGDDNPRIKIEMSTGLRDKNGNLIWEGDVVRLATDETDVKAVVIFQNGCFCPGDDEPFGDSTMWEVIGNVHTEEQNKEK